MNRKGFAAVVFLLFLPVNEICAKAQVLERKELSSPVHECIDIRSAELFIDNDKNTFVQINGFLRVNNKWIKMDEYGSFLNGFLKDGQLYTAFEKDGNIDVYKVKKGFELTSRIKIIKGPNILWGGAGFKRIFPVPGEDNSYFLQGECSKFPTNPYEFLFCFTSGGHGIIYTKPILAEVRDGKMLRYLKFRYRGKLDESFVIEEAVKRDNSINFLGYRKLVEPAFGPDRYPPQPVILHYAGYNIKKKKVTRNHILYENTPGYDKNTDTSSDYGQSSMDSFGDDVFVVFSLRKESRMSNRTKFDKSFVTSDIYFRQCGKDGPGDTEKIAEGFSPVVRADSFGNVHVIWVNNDGVFFHKTRKDGRWSETEIILRDSNICQYISFGRRIFAEFDKDNNLNAVYPSENNLIYTKVKLD